MVDCAGESCNSFCDPCSQICNKLYNTNIKRILRNSGIIVLYESDAARLRTNTEHTNLNCHIDANFNLV